jgi:hypothetical protein
VQVTAHERLTLWLHPRSLAVTISVRGYR